MTEATDTTRGIDTRALSNGHHERSEPQTFAKSQPPVVPAEADRLGAAWGGKWWILAATVVVLAATYLISQAVPKTYSSSAEVSVSAAPSASGPTSDMVTAGSDLASQYAQFANSSPVAGPAAQLVGMSTTDLESDTTTGTLAGQNVIQVTVQASNATDAEKRATAVADSLVTYIQDSGVAQVKSYNASVNAGTASLDAEIAKAQLAVSVASNALTAAAASTSANAVSAASARLSSAESLLTTLSDRRQQLLTNAALQAATLTPTVVRLGSASPASIVEPKPTLYAGIAGLLALIISTQLVVTLSERRRRLALAESRA